MSGLGPFGDHAGFITATPQGTGPVPFWNPTVGSPDMQFIGSLLDDVERTACVDERRVFVAGLSNGAMMASGVACAYSDRVAAIAPVAGIIDPKPCTLRRPVPVIAFHGTADPFVSFTGGLGPKAASLPAPDGSGRTLGSSPGGTSLSGHGGPTIPQVVATWAVRDGCSATPVERSVAADVAEVTFPHCPAGVDVELYRIEGGGHAWPGSAFSASIASYVGPTTTAISADMLIWAFFQAHPLEG